MSIEIIAAGNTFYVIKHIKYEDSIDYKFLRLFSRLENLLIPHDLKSYLAKISEHNKSNKRLDYNLQ